MAEFDVRSLLNKVIIITGHFGCGKTNVSANLAKRLSEYGKTYLIDYDNVNPYFRAADVKEEFEKSGITVITSEFANTNVDIPSVSPLVFSALQDNDSTVIFDVGGDMLGAVSLGFLHNKICERGYKMLYVFSAYRPLTQTSDQILKILSEVEDACSLKAGALINNSNIGEYTEVSDIENTDVLAKEICGRSTLPLLFTSYMTNKAPSVSSDVLKIQNYTKKLF